MAINTVSMESQSLHELGSRLLQWTRSKVFRTRADNNDDAEVASSTDCEMLPLVVGFGTTQHWCTRVLRAIDQIYDNRHAVSHLNRPNRQLTQNAQVDNEVPQASSVHRDLTEFQPGRMHHQRARIVEYATNDIKNTISPAAFRLGEESKVTSTPHHVNQNDFDEEEFHDAVTSFSFPFLRLPYDMRFEVFKQVVSSPIYVSRSQRRWPSVVSIRNAYHEKLHQNPLLSLMLTCRQIHAEILHSFPQIVWFHIQIRGPFPFRPQDSVSELPMPIGVLHQWQLVTGQWTWSEGISCPSIPLELLRQGGSRWQRVQMVANIRVPGSCDGKTFADRFREALILARTTHNGIDEYIHFGVKGQLHVGVILRVQDQGLGRRACWLSVSGGHVDIRTFCEGLPSKMELVAIFWNVFGHDLSAGH